MCQGSARERTGSKGSTKKKGPDEYVHASVTTGDGSSGDPLPSPPMNAIMNHPSGEVTLNGIKDQVRYVFYLEPSVRLAKEHCT